MANPFAIEPVNALSVLMAGQQGYDTANQRYKQNQIEDVRKQVAAGNMPPEQAIRMLIGGGDIPGATLYSHQAQQAQTAAHQKTLEGFQGRQVAIAEQQANEPKYMTTKDADGNDVVLELKAGKPPVVVRPSDVPAGHAGMPTPAAPAIPSPPNPALRQSSLTPETSGSMVGRPGERIVADASGQLPSSFDQRFAGAAPQPQPQPIPQQPTVAPSQVGTIPQTLKPPPGINQPEFRKTIAHETAKVAAARPAAEAHTTDAISNLDRLIVEAKAIKNDAAVGRITGLYGAVPSIPGSAAADVEARLETLKSQTGFSVLQNMRDNSKTGGALGQVSDKENIMLQNNLTALTQKQSEEAFKKSLQRTIDYAEGAKGRLRTAFEKTHGVPLAGSNPVPAASGARQASDGNWYIDDPNRPGKYLQVVR